MSVETHTIRDTAKAIAEQPWLTRAERDSLTVQIFDAIHDAVMAERDRCAGIARAEYEKRFDNRDDYPAARVHDFLVVAVAIGKGIKADFNRAPKTEAE